MARWRRRPRPLLVVGLALLLVVGLLVVGTLAWQRAHRTSLEEALQRVPASSKRVSFTDWSLVRSRLHARLGDTPGRKAVEGLMSKAYDSDFSAASSIDEAAVALQENFGFGPATAQWEAYAQGRKGATMVLKVPDGSDFDVLADNLRSVGFKKPKKDDGVWVGGPDLVAALDPTISPELQYISLLKDQGLVVTSDEQPYAATAARVAAGKGDSFASVAGAGDLADQLDEPANALLWGRDFACTDLSMSSADDDTQAQAKARVAEVGGVTPLAGLAMGMEPDRTLRVVEHFEDSDRAEKNLRPRAKLAVGEAIGRGGSFSDNFRLTSSKSVGSDVVLRLRPRSRTGYVLSALYDGPVVFATC